MTRPLQRLLPAVMRYLTVTAGKGQDTITLGKDDKGEFTGNDIIVVNSGKTTSAAEAATLEIDFRDADLSKGGEFKLLTNLIPFHPIPQAQISG